MNWPQCEGLVDLAVDNVADDRGEPKKPVFRFGRNFELRPLRITLLEFQADFTSFKLLVSVPDRDAQDSSVETKVGFRFKWETPAKNDDELVTLVHAAIQRIVAHEIYERLFQGDKRYKEVHPEGGASIL